MRQLELKNSSGSVRGGLTGLLLLLLLLLLLWWVALGPRGLE